MSIGSIGTTLNRGFETLGKTLQDGQAKGYGQKALKWIAKVNEPVKSAANPTMFAVSLFTCVLGPRITAAGKRSNTEKREVITRDIFAISTLLFGMRAINDTIAKAAQKATGLILKSKGGVLSSEQLMSKYIISDAKGLEGLVGWLGNNGGNAAKALTIDAKKGGVLSGLANQLFTGGIAGKNADEIVGAIQNTQNKELVGQIVDVLSKADKTNPLITKGKFINSGVIKTVGFAVTVAVLGIGIQLFNQVLTKRLDKKKAEGKISQEEWQREKDFIYRLTPEQTQTFQNFLGFRQN